MGGRNKQEWQKEDYNVGYERVGQQMEEMKNSVKNNRWILHELCNQTKTSEQQNCSAVIHCQ